MLHGCAFLSIIVSHRPPINTLEYSCTWASDTRSFHPPKRRGKVRFWEVAPTFFFANFFPYAGFVRLCIHLSGHHSPLCSPASEATRVTHNIRDRVSQRQGEGMVSHWFTLGSWISSGENKGGEVVVETGPPSPMVETFLSAHCSCPGIFKGLYLDAHPQDCEKGHLTLLLGIPNSSMTFTQNVPSLEVVSGIPATRQVSLCCAPLTSKGTCLASDSDIITEPDFGSWQVSPSA